MIRFGSDRTSRGTLKFACSLLLSVVVLAIFLLGLNALSRRTLQEQKSSLETSLHRSIIECYALEGRYPESLAYLQESYHVSYNEDRFYVDYHPIGENILPTFTVVVRGGAG